MGSKLTSKTLAATLSVSLLVAAAMGVACSAGSQQGHGPPTGTGGSNSDGGGTGGGGIVLGDGGTTTPTGPTWIPANLPPPWQYYDEGNDRAFKDPSLGADVRDAFGGTVTSTDAPALVYPLDTAMHPLNLGDITFQWSQGSASNTVFRIDAVGQDGKTSRFYVPCSKAQCSYVMPESDWLWLAAGYAGGEVTITITGTDGAGGPVATSPAIKAHFSPEPVFGALYYWASNIEALKRATFGAKKAVPFIEPESATNEFKCVACHSVSRNGKVIAFAVSNLHGETVAAIQTAPTEDPANPYVRPTMGTTPFSAEQANVSWGGSLEGQPTDHFGHNPALSPDGSLAVVNGIPEPDSPADQYIELRNALTGASIRRYGVGDSLFGAQTLPILPEWSPDGGYIVVAMANYAPNYQCLWTYVTCNSTIAVIPIVGGNSFGPPIVIATSANPDDYHYYPTWSPDGKWIVFQTARRTFDDKGNVSEPRSLGNANGVLRMVPANGGPHVCPGPSCIELTNGPQYSLADALAGNGKRSTWPKFTPFSQGADDNIMFVSYTSRINYGFLANGRSQLWMFAIDTSKVQQGQDPSYAPIWLPYQDYSDGSLTPYWTETLPCQMDPNGTCTGCVAGESCYTTSDNRCECRGDVVK